MALTLISGVASAEEALVWTASEKGSQGFWHCWPDKLYADEIGFPCRSIVDTEDGFTFSPYNVFTDVSYRAVIEKRTTNEHKPGSTDATRNMQFSREWTLGRLPELGRNQQFHLQSRIWNLNEDASTFMAEFVFAGETVTCRVERTQYEITIDPVPDIREMKYGPHFRHSINFHKAKSDRPTPLVLNIHGGGWGALDKSAAQISFNSLLAAGICVASINYRFVGQAEADGVEPPVEACLTDAARALQFLRSMAEELNIDRQRIGATGGSAGGATTLWNGWKTHSPLFGLGLKRRLDELGVENYLTYDGKPAQKYGNPVEFFLAKLKRE